MQHRLSTNPMFSGGAELVPRPDAADGEDLQASEDGRAKMISVDNPLRDNSAADAGGDGGSGMASKRWGAIRSKVQTRIEIRQRCSHSDAEVGARLLRAGME